MSISLRAGVIGTFTLLIGALCLVGALAVSASVRSAQQARTLQEDNLVPVVGLSSLSQNLDQERDLLSIDISRVSPARKRAISDELSSLDRSILATTTRV